MLDMIVFRKYSFYEELVKVNYKKKKIYDFFYVRMLFKNRD